MNITEKSFYRGWAALASFIAGVHDHPTLVADAMKEHGITLDDLKKADVDDFDMDILKAKLNFS